MTPILPTSTPTPRPLKTILWAVLLFTLGGALLSFLGVRLYLYLGLSLSALSRGFFWTLFTYPFTAPPISLLDTLFRLAFDLLFLWIFGVSLIERTGQKRFLFLFFGATLLGGLVATLGLSLWPSPLLFTGPSPFIFSLITAWTLLHAERTAHLASFAIRPFWIFLLLIGLNLAFDALGKNWTHLLANIAGVLFGYGFCLISERTPSSISWLYPMERLVLRALDPGGKSHKTTKIIDFQTGKPLVDDEEFMDAMLAKISLHGESSLSEEEKKRMHKISKNKASK
jgi:membrane associated rhomboid family serine protease